MSLLIRFADGLVDRLNPIVVKELRQAVQGRFLTGLLLFFLLVQLGTLSIFLLTTGIDTVDLLGGSRQGRDVFSILYALLLFASIVMLPIFAAIRLHVERSGENLSLVFITTLKPRSIVAGKLLATQTLGLLLFSASLPFLSFTYFLRGVDLLSITAALVLGFVVSTLSTQAALLLSCLPATRFLKVLMGLAGLVGLLIVFFTTTSVSYELVARGIGSQMASSGFWWATGSFFAVAALGSGLLFVVTVALVAPPAANRALPVRLFLTAAWLLTLVIAAVAAVGFGENDALESWIFSWMMMAGVALLVAISARDSIGLRVAQELPHGIRRRTLAFLFWSGSANGVAWAALLIVATLFASLCLEASVNAAGSRSLGLLHDAWKALGIGAYFFAYAMTALLVQRRFLRRRLRDGYTWVVALLLVVAGSVLPPIAAFLAANDAASRTDFFERWIFLNPFAPLWNRTSSWLIVLSLVWAATATVATSRWLAAQIRAFRPPEPAP